MNRIFSAFLSLMIVLTSCQQKSDNNEGHDVHADGPIEQNENQTLYNEVMEIHDEVMPKMDDIHRKKEELKKIIKEKATISAEEKQKIEATIAKLDSAGEGMMVWMRQFNPIPDSAGEEKAREYLETEMEKVKKVREGILSALKEADEE